MSPTVFTSLAVYVIFTVLTQAPMVRAMFRAPLLQSPFMSLTPTQEETTLHFDDLSLPETGLTSLPDPYHHLKFSSFSVFAPHSPALSNLITPVDLNCAVSSPNALLGARAAEHGSPASFEIAEATSIVEGDLKREFTLKKMMIKPLAAPEPGTNLSIKGYREDKEALEWSVWFPDGFDRMFEVRIEEFSEVRWAGLQKVEIWADFGYDKLDWEFCLDDLVVEFSGILNDARRDADEVGSGVTQHGRQFIIVG